MFSSDQYQLIDFGRGRKLERFGSRLLDRPSPAADGVVCADLAQWGDCDARYQRTSGQQGVWTQHSELPSGWQIKHPIGSFEVRPTPFGHVGLFVEQAENWDWIHQQISQRGPGLKVLNLFAYTGGSTLAAARAGAEVVHVDSARNIVQWARRNAELSGLEQAPIRWIVEDVRRFVGRELKRGNRYDAIILDPPSYGHGPKGEVWKVFEHLRPLLDDCLRLTNDRAAMLLLTWHTSATAEQDIRQILEQTRWRRLVGRPVAQSLGLRAADQRVLSSGQMIRWSQGEIS